MYTQFSDSAEAYLVSRAVFILEYADHRQCWTDCLSYLVSTGVVKYRMVVCGGGCFK